MSTHIMDSTISEYKYYNLQLQGLVKVVLADMENPPLQEVNAALDGQAGTRLQELVSLDDRRANGAFFTSSSLRARLIPEVDDNSTEDGNTYEPTCGAGDLLVAWSYLLPIKETLSATLEDWGNIIFASDIHPEFVSAAKNRLVLAAIKRGTKIDLHQLDADNLFPNIQVRDCLDHLELYTKCKNILLNPPFCKVSTPERHRSWTSGKVSMAAIVLTDCIQNADVGTRIRAILPDVLRSGSRYSKWRAMVEPLVTVNRCEIIGQFDDRTDVDVYIYDITVNGVLQLKNSKSSEVQTDSAHIVADFFDVRVGPVVPHRDPVAGEEHPFIETQSLPLSGIFDADVAPTRQYMGTTFTPPFVAIRRTSRPGSSSRGYSVLVTGTRPIAVENHLVVFLPKQGGRNTCEQLVRVLSSEETCAWLDIQIRCRHLTTRVVKNIPCSPDNASIK